MLVSWPATPASTAARSSATLPAHVLAAVERGGVREVEAVGCGHVLLEGVALAGDGEEVKDAAVVVVEDDDGQREPEAASGHEPADVAGQRDVAAQTRHGRRLALSASRCTSADTAQPRCGLRRA
jgi:hypothetical protein